ncbi:MAG: hypothetical protein ACI8V4_000654 [Ilumatobacter sp.]|jgi:hypothetical protein
MKPMKFSNRLAPILIGNIVVWMIFAISDSPGFPWPIFVTLASIPGFLMVLRGPQGPGRDRNRDRNRNRNRNR